VLTIPRVNGFDKSGNICPIMFESTVLTFTDLDAYHASIRGVQVDGVVTSRGDFRVKWTGIQLERLSMQRSEETLPRVANNAVDPKIYGIVFATNPNQPSAYLKGLELSPADMIIFSVGSEGHNRTEAAFQWGSITLAHEDLAAAGEVLIGRELTAPSVTQCIRPPLPLLLRLSNLHKAAGLLAETCPDILANPQVARAMEQALMEAMIACAASGDAADARSANCHHGAVVRRLEEFLEANFYDTIYVHELCKATGVSYPTLRGCCQEQLGMSPKRYLWLRRMNLAHRALRVADPVTATVTEIATKHGFWELGRFSVAYHGLFGEPPSVSLRRPPAIDDLAKFTGRPSRLVKSA
jgi:AraC-like DNA-binding protein